MGNVQVMLKIKNPSILKTLIVILSELPLKRECPIHNGTLENRIK